MSRLTLFMLALTLLSGCASPAYYGQAISGHLSLMRSREPIDETLARLPPDSTTASRLRMVQDILEFARTEMDLPPTDSYQSFADTDADAVTWNVVATPPYDLTPETWCFPVAGCVPYRGYFKQDKAEKFSRKLSDKGLDSTVSRATAYSTLGWFDDPVVSTMLRGSEANLAGVLFHELAHQALYVSGETAFNESYASFLEIQGVRAWMLARGDAEGLAVWEESEAAYGQFLALLRSTRMELVTLYGQAISDEMKAAGKVDIIEALKVRYEQIVNEHWNGVDRYGGFFQPLPNNADFALLGSYNDGLCAFEILWVKAAGDFGQFNDLARQQARLSGADLAQWLQTPCPEASNPRFPIEPVTNL